MANPQKENGYTPIANELIEKLAGASSLSARELRVMLVIMRKTWGWKKKKDRISLGQIKELTGIAQQHVSSILTSLSKRGYVIRHIPASGRGVRTYEIGKNYEIWDIPSYPQLFPHPINTLPVGGSTPSRGREVKRGVRTPVGGNNKRKETLTKGARRTFLRKSGENPEMQPIGKLLKNRYD